MSKKEDVVSWFNATITATITVLTIYILCYFIISFITWTFLNPLKMIMYMPDAIFRITIIIILICTVIIKLKDNDE